MNIKILHWQNLFLFKIFNLWHREKHDLVIFSEEDPFITFNLIMFIQSQTLFY